jgi:hypothetical protein
MDAKLLLFVETPKTSEGTLPPIVVPVVYVVIVVGDSDNYNNWNNLYNGYTICYARSLKH